MSIDSKELFTHAKSVDFHDYLVSHCGHEFVKKRTLCPFHADTKPSATIKMLENEVFRCHACGWTKGIIDYVMDRYKLTNFEAAKKIALDMGIYSESDFEDRELSADEKKEYAAKQLVREKEVKKRNEALEKKKASRLAALKRSQGSVLSRIQIQAPILAENFMRLEDDKKDTIKAMFFNWDKVSVWAFDYIGYSHEHDSIAILNRRSGENGYVSNIKHRQKYIWQDNTINKNMRMDGKWIGEAHLAASPFPLDYYLEHTDNKIVICEGEKDALNLLGYGINTLTLGGVSNSWNDNNYKELLRDKEVLIWFDHDKAGYENAIKKALEFKDVASCVKIVSFMHIDRTLENKYDISDYLFAQKFISKEVLFETLVFSSFVASNQLINEFSIFYDEDYFTTRMQKLYEVAAKKNFERNIIHLLLQKSTAVKSMDDEKMDELEEAMKQTKLLTDTFKGAGLNEDEAVKKIIHALSLKTSLIGQHRKMGESDIADHLLSLAKREHHQFASYKEEIYIWNGIHFERLEKHQIQDFIILWMSDKQAGRVNQKQRTPDMVDKVVRHILLKSLSLEPILKTQREKNIRVINMLNGTLKVFESGKHIFKTIHEPSDGCISVLDFEYNESAAAPKWGKFLSRALPDETDRKALMQFFGYTLYPKHLYETFLFLYGESGGNGKSVILETLRKCFGRESISSLQLQQFENHQMASLEDKLLNIGAEVDAKNLNDGQFANLKLASGGEPININPKGSKGYDIYGQQIPKFVFAGNSKPRAGMDGGMFRRIVYLELNATIPDGEKVHKLNERFFDEMSGIINIALRELTGLIKGGKFAESKSMAQAKDEYKVQSDPILSYASEHISSDPKMMIPKKYVYAHYKVWCEESGHHAMAQKTFLERLNKHREFKETRKTFSEGNLGKGLSSSDFYLVGLEFSQDSSIPHYKFKGIELAISHSNFSEAERILLVKGGLFNEN